MSWYKKAKGDDPEYQKMKDWFTKRTDRHINSVQKYCKKLEDYDSKRFKGLIERGEEHDQSKFKDPEIDPYIYVTWSYKCKDDGVDWEPPKGMDDKMNEATTYHVLNNSHHPEFHAGEDSEVINEEDRDDPKRDKIIDGTKMPDIDIAEMVADWVSVGNERGNSAKGWADKNINARWKFTKAQENLIYELIEVCEGS